MLLIGLTSVFDRCVYFWWNWINNLFQMKMVVCVHCFGVVGCGVFFVAFNGSFHLFIYMYVSQLQIATTKERAHARARTHTHTQCMYRCTRGKMHARADSLAPCDFCLKAARKILVKTKTKNNKHFLVFEYCYYTMEYDTTLLSTWENSFGSTKQNDD